MAAEGVIKYVVRVSETRTGTGTVKRVVIPKEIAGAMGLKKGDQVVLEYWGGEIRIRRF